MRMMSSTMFNMIVDYYKKLYQNFESKNVPEISSDLGISENTLRLFFYLVCEDFEETQKINKLNLIVLLCTKFGPRSRYRKSQKIFLETIKHRELIRNIKDGAARLNNKKYNNI